MDSPAPTGSSIGLLKSSSSHSTENPIAPNAGLASSTAFPSDQSSAMSIGKRLFANLIPSTAYQPLKMPYAEDEHYLLSSDSVYYINDKYLSSIVAFTLR
jgi:hypothetical protein